MIVAAFIDGLPADGLPLDDRGLAYGDGLFETLRVVAHRAPLWHRHLARLDEGCSRLGIAPPDPSDLACDLALASTALDGDGVVKLILTRAAGARGYRPTAGSSRRIVLAFAHAPLPEPLLREGLNLRWCTQQLPVDPTLAGIKHLNRLHQVMARAEWSDAEIHDGLMCDTRGHLVCATSANVYVRFGTVLATPALDDAGVSGVARAEILAQGGGPAAPQTRAILPDHLREADEVFLCNAIHGVMPVRSVGDQHFLPGAATRAWQQHFAALGIGWSPAR